MIAHPTAGTWPGEMGELGGRATIARLQALGKQTPPVQDERKETANAQKCKDTWKVKMPTHRRIEKRLCPRNVRYKVACL